MRNTYEFPTNEPQIGDVRSMKIIHYHMNMRLEQGGIVRAVIDLCGALAAAGHDVTLLSPSVADLPKKWMKGTSGYPRVIHLDNLQSPLQLFNRATLQIIEEQLAQAQVLHLHGMWTTSNVQLMKIATRLHIPYIYSIHGMLNDWCLAEKRIKKEFYLGLFGRRILKHAAAVHCTAQAELQQAQRQFPVGQGIVIPLAFDFDEFINLPGSKPAEEAYPSLETDQFKVLLMSRLHHVKGVEYLLTALKQLRDTGQMCQVYIAGTGEEKYEQKLRAMVRRLKLNDSVHFLGFVTGQLKVALFEACDAFVLPTTGENFGFVLFEALAAGLPVITTQGPCTWPELELSGGAVIVQQKASAIAEAITSLAKDAPRRELMGQAGRAWVRENLSGERILQDYEQLYERVIHEHKK